MYKKRPDLGKIFFDCHLHFFNLSHPGIIMFINRFLLNGRMKIDDLIGLKMFKLFARMFSGITVLIVVAVFAMFFSFKIDILSFGINIYPLLILTALVFIAAYFVIKKILAAKKSIKKILNAFYFIENDITSQILLLERDFVSLDAGLVNRSRYLKSEYHRYINENDFKMVDMISNEAGEVFQKQGSMVMINSVKIEAIEKVVLTPLIMDFGYKTAASKKIHYRTSPVKPMSNQIIDLFYGIHRYMHKSPYKIFEIYPFMGISPCNYELGDIQLLLNYYFQNYERDFTRFRLEYEKRFLNTSFSLVFDNEVDRNIESLRDFFFAGIKLYPSFGCDPASDEDEHKKTEFILEFCRSKDIPITVHYSRGGFETRRAPGLNISPKNTAK